MPTPHFLIIGAQKSGTSSLYSALAQHPQIAAATRKEIHFFDQHYSRGKTWYQQQLGEASEGQLNGEASPFYLAHPLAAERIQQHNPTVRLIALLREPAARAYSHFQHQTRRGVETLSFADALAREDERTQQHWQALAEGACPVGSPAQQFSYRQRGYYAEQLQRYLARFPREQLLVLPSEDFFVDPLASCQRCFAFLGIDPDFIAQDLAVRKPGHYPAPEQTLLQRLREHYQPYNQQLFQLLGERYDWQ